MVVAPISFKKAWHCAPLFLVFATYAGCDVEDGEGGALSITTPLGLDFPCGDISLSLMARGGTPPYRWTVEDAADLPTGLQLTSDGELVGSSCGQEAFPGITVTDGMGASASAAFNICVGAVLPEGEEVRFFDPGTEDC